MQLGKGTFGEVYRCESTGTNAALLGATFALKRLIRTPVCGTGQVSDADSFDNEFHIMRQLAACQFKLRALGAQFGGHAESSVTHILMPVFDTSLLHFVRQHANTEQLEQLGWFEAEDVVSWLMQIAQGLLYMHDCGLAHLDLKPENVLVRVGGISSIKLLALSDFGTTVHAGSVTNLSVIMTRAQGTPGFIAPELFAATSERPCVDLFAADIFSLGVLASYVISGLLPTGDLLQQRGIPAGGDAVEPAVQLDYNDPAEWDSLRGLISACLVGESLQRPTAAHLVASRLSGNGCVSADKSACEQRRDLLVSPLSNRRSKVAGAPSSDQSHTADMAQKVIADARTEAATILADAQKMLSDARFAAEQIVLDAKKQAADMIANAHVSAQGIVSDAKRQAAAAQIKHEASTEAFAPSPAAQGQVHAGGNQDVPPAGWAFARPSAQDRSLDKASSVVADVIRRRCAARYARHPSPFPSISAVTIVLPLTDVTTLTNPSADGDSKKDATCPRR